MYWHSSLKMHKCISHKPVHICYSPLCKWKNKVTSQTHKYSTTWCSRAGAPGECQWINTLSTSWFHPVILLLQITAYAWQIPPPPHTEKCGGYASVLMVRFYRDLCGICPSISFVVWWQWAVTLDETIPRTGLDHYSVALCHWARHVSWVGARENRSHNQKNCKSNHRCLHSLSNHRCLHSLSNHRCLHSLSNHRCLHSLNFQHCQPRECATCPACIPYIYL